MHISRVSRAISCFRVSEIRQTGTKGRTGDEYKQVIDERTVGAPLCGLFRKHVGAIEVNRAVATKCDRER